jgi:hypothetical protein
MLRRLAMSKRINHAATARRVVKNAGALIETHDDAGALALAFVANAHATLALAEQQRIANLIVLSGWVVDTDKQSVADALDGLRENVAAEVWEGLGL